MSKISLISKRGCRSMFSVSFAAMQCMCIMWKSHFDLEHRMENNFRHSIIFLSSQVNRLYLQAMKRTIVFIQRRPCTLSQAKFESHSEKERSLINERKLRSVNTSAALSLAKTKSYYKTAEITVQSQTSNNKMRIIMNKVDFTNLVSARFEAMECSVQSML